VYFFFFFCVLHRIQIDSVHLVRTRPTAHDCSTKNGVRRTTPYSASGPANLRWSSGTSAHSKASVHRSRSPISLARRRPRPSSPHVCSFTPDFPVIYLFTFDDIDDSVRSYVLARRTRERHGHRPARCSRRGCRRHGQRDAPPTSFLVLFAQAGEPCPTTRTATSPSRDWFVRHQRLDLWIFPPFFILDCSPQASVCRPSS
jgi:hypothetical protein